LVDQIKLIPETAGFAPPSSISGTLPGIKGPVFTLKIVSCEVHVDELFAAWSMNGEFRTAKPVGPSVVAAEEIFDPAFLPLLYQADLGFEALASDPTLRVRWTVREVLAGGSNGQLVMPVQDTPASNVSDSILALPVAALAQLPGTSFRVECRLYRVFGSAAEDIFNEALTVRVEDRLSRALPYVQWEHDVSVPTYRREANGTFSGSWEKTHRRSKIHRTALPGRCRMASHFADPNRWGKTTITYLPALPFPRDDLIANRVQVCDYCFFGGPSKTLPLIP
jgi:hypothetical protein